jgi:hypothetical protein
MSRSARIGVPVRTGSVDPHPHLPLVGAPATGFPTGLTGAAVAGALPLASALFLAFAVPARRLRSHSTGEAFPVPYPPDRSHHGGER